MCLRAQVVAVLVVAWTIVAPCQSRAADKEADASALRLAESAEGVDEGPAAVSEESPAAPSLPKRSETPSRQRDGDSASPRQEVAAPPRGADSTPPADGPPVYYLPDAQGRLRRVLGLSYEAFLEAWRRQEAAASAAAPPRYELVNGQLTGVVDEQEETVAWTIVLTARLNESGWTPAGLRLGESVLQNAQVAGGVDGEHVAFDAERREYVAWLRGQAGDVRTIRLQALSAVSNDGEQRSAGLDVPDATTSLVELDVPGGSCEWDAATPPLVRPLESHSAVRSRWQASGVRGRLTLRWESFSASESLLSSAVEATTQTTVTLDPSQLTYDATLQLIPSGRPWKRRRIALPRGAELTVASSSPDYEIVPATNGRGAAASDRQTVEIRTRRAMTSPLTVQLSARAELPAADGDQRGLRATATGFEVLGAFRQTGYVALRVNDQLHADWSTTGRIEQIELAELPATLAGGASVAGFRTTSRSWSLQVRTQPREVSVRASPRYDLRYADNELTLEATFDFQVVGGRIFDLRISLGGWSLAEGLVDSGGVVALDELHETAEGDLILPLINPDAGQFRLRIPLRRRWPGAAMAMPLPIPRQATVLPGVLRCTADPSSLLTVDARQSTGVSAEGAAAETDLPAGATASDATIRLATTPAAQVAFRVQRRPGEVRAAVKVEARLGDDELVVAQNMDLSILYEPIAALSLTADRSLLENPSFLLAADGEPLPSSTWSVEPGAADGGRDLTLSIALPRPMRGQLSLQAVSRWPWSSADDGAPPALETAILRPQAPATLQVEIAADSIAGRTLRLEGSSPTELRRLPEPSTSGGRISWQVIAAPAELPSLLRWSQARPSADVAGRPRLFAAWAQSWLAGQRRQDRFVFRLGLRGSEIVLELPSSAQSSAWDLLVDGEPADWSRDDAGRIHVELPAVRAETPPVRRQVVCELLLQRPYPLDWRNDVTLDMPRIVGATATVPFYWHVALPSDHAVWSSPAGAVSEHWVGWSQGRWGRHPALSQTDFESWSGAASRAGPSETATQAVFACLQLPQKLSLTTYRGTWFRAAAILAAFAAGMVLLRTSWAKNPRFWLSVVAAQTAAAWLVPETGLATLQIVAAAGLLLLAAFVLRGLLAAPPAPNDLPGSRFSAARADSTAHWQPGGQPPERTDVRLQPGGAER